MVDELAAVSEGLAEKGPDFERRIGEEAGIRNRPDPAAAEVADDDLLLGDLDDKGHGSRVVVAKGDPIPPRAARASPSRGPGGATQAAVGDGLVGPLRLAAP